VPLRSALYLLANLMLLALGLYLMGVTRALAFSERCGQKLWRHLQPLTRRYLPARTAAQAFPLGLLWGWLPCGLVYSALATALTSGSAVARRWLDAAFGAGTLPNLLLAGLLATRLQAYARQPGAHAPPDHSGLRRLGAAGPAGAGPAGFLELAMHVFYPPPPAPRVGKHD
jgi:sulfite exporter TauE/SafE